MTASINSSLMTSAFPKLSKISFTTATSSSDTNAFGQRADIPSKTIAGVFGIVRTNFIVFPNVFSISLIVFPAAIETITISSLITSLISAITSGNKFGFTAKNKISAKEATSLLSNVVNTSYCSFKRVNASLLLSATIKALFSTKFAFLIPEIIAPPIFPPPIKPIFCCIYATPFYLLFLQSFFKHLFYINKH